MKSIVHILPALLLVLIPHAQANVSGASNTSCYNHFIHHIRFDQLEVVRSCENPSYPNCRILLLSVRCADESLPYCCDGLNMMDGKRFMYTLCDYFFEWSSVHNIGYLIQARVDPGQSLVFSNTSEIVGTWTPRIGNKVLYCNSSMLADEDAEPLPNSITHSMIYLQQDVDAPPSLNMTWMANSTLTSSNSQMEDSIDITFFYTVVRDVSTNYFPYTRANLSFELRPHPSTLPTTVPPTTVPTTVPSPTTQKDPIEKPNAANIILPSVVVITIIAALLTLGIDV